MKVKYPKLLDAIRSYKEIEVKLGILSATRLESCIALDYSKHCNAINKGIETEDFAISHYEMEET